MGAIQPEKIDKPQVNYYDLACRMLEDCGDFYDAKSLREIYGYLDQVLFDLLGQSSFTLFFPSKLENQLKPTYSNFSEPETVEQWVFDLDDPNLHALLQFFDSSGRLIVDEPELLDRMPFRSRYCALLREEQTVMALLFLHEGLDEEMFESFPVDDILEPVIKHFALALMRLKNHEEFERNLNETNAKLLAINEIGELLGQLDLNILLSKLIMLVLQVIRAEVGNLMIYERGVLRSQVEWGMNEDEINSIRRPDGTAVVDWVIESRRPLLISDLKDSNRYRVDNLNHNISSMVFLPLFTSKKDLGVIGVVNTEGQDTLSAENMATLQTVTSLASIAIENAMLHREAIEREVFQEQLRIARQIWENILPKNVPSISGATVSARSVPASVVGGDFYDFIPLEDGSLGLVLADVSGKGIPAAMIMNMAKSVLHIEAMRNSSPAEVLSTVNDLLVESTKIDSFVTLIYALIDPNGRKMLLANAGHIPCLIYRKATGKCDEYFSTNIPLAIMENQVFEMVTVDINPGDCVVIYTDGVTEAMNRKREMYEFDRLKEVLEQTKDEDTSETIINRIYRSVEVFSRDAPQQDDTTVVVFKAIV